jgi:hypothetical protein
MQQQAQPGSQMTADTTVDSAGICNREQQQHVQRIDVGNPSQVALLTASN